MQLSIIIPTHKRRDILRQCLECIGKQTLLRSSGASKGKPFAQDIEVVVVSDGPDEKTSEMIASLSWPFEIQHFAIPKSQQGVARNRAVEKARGKYSLLISDDIFLAEDACERHLNAHGAMEAPNPKHQICSIRIYNVGSQSEDHPPHALDGREWRAIWLPPRRAIHTHISPRNRAAFFYVCKQPESPNKNSLATPLSGRCVALWLGGCGVGSEARSERRTALL